MVLLIDSRLIDIVDILKYIHCPKCFTILSYSFHFSNLSNNNMNSIQIAFVCNSINKKCDFEKHFTIHEEKINSITVEYLQNIIQKHVVDLDENKI